MICANCKYEIPEGHKFCPMCGTKGEQMQTEAVNQPDMPQVQQPANGWQAPQQIQAGAQQYMNQQTPQAYAPSNIPVPKGLAPVVGVGTYIGMSLISWIPVVGFIMTIIWAVQKGNKSKRNFAAALLILIIIGTAVGVLAYSASISLLKTVLEGLLNSQANLN